MNKKVRKFIQLCVILIFPTFIMFSSIASGAEQTADAGAVQFGLPQPVASYEPPVDTPVPPTATPEPPTATPEPPVDTPVPPDSGCTFTQGYWKNHPEDWPVASLMLGSTTYTQGELLAIFAQPTRGDATYILAHQLIAAKLNIISGADQTTVAATVANGDTLLAANPLGSKPKNPVRADLIQTAEKLDDFNNGRIGPGHCG